MGFWKNLFGKKTEEPANSVCGMCQKKHYKADADFENHEPIIIDGHSYADEYCSKECEDAANLKSTAPVSDIEIDEAVEDDESK